MKDRIIGALIVVVYALLMLKATGIFYLFLVLFLGLQIIGELLDITGLSEYRFIPFVIFAFSIVLFNHLHYREIIIPLTVLALFFYLTIIEEIESKTFFPFTLTFIYVTVGIGSISTFNWKFLVFLISIVWSVDTLAYLTGRCFGKRKLAPSISPKKTVEGSIGGSLGGTAISLFVGVKLGIINLSLLTIGILFALTIISQIGDLFESYLKRYFGVKDSGSTIPGHGGVFDRLDSSIAVAPFLLMFLNSGIKLF
ncbi:MULTISPECIES: phosphatidate cytidylyltransferase [unclassified Desulfurobacterium]|uniref:phosphatidate cytidylyltransferase n=1 Tax=Desulfurobacterium sp. TC5-1 TaxID=1158318 RepID=UPI0003B4C9FA|nr:phosphatidate cytidylyltransferase [Desulfurobacterium sp. TC5-1]